MKKLFLILTVALFSLGTVNAFAQEAEAAAATEEVAAVAEEAAAVAETTIEGETMHHVLMQKFLEGGWGWMLPVLLCLVLGCRLSWIWKPKLRVLAWTLMLPKGWLVVVGSVWEVVFMRKWL